MEEAAALWVGAGAVDADGGAYPFRGARVSTTSRPTDQAHGVVAWDPYLELREDGWPVDADLHLWHLLAPACDARG